MKWKNVKLNGKFGVAFGTIMVLMLFVAFWAVMGINEIISNAGEVIDGNKLKAMIVQKEVDHLNWASAVSELLNNEIVSKLNVETDPHKCGFGSWYYSEDRTKAEELVPELKELLSEIEEPHKKLHESAIEIQKYYTDANASLGMFLAEKRGDHVQWMNTIRKEILSGKKSFSVQKDPHRCGLGKWIYSDETRQMAMHDNDLANFLKDVEDPHIALHQCAEKIEYYLKNNKHDQAIEFMNSVCEDKANSVLEKLDYLIATNNMKMEQLDMARSIYATQTTKDLKDVQQILRKIKKTTEKNIMTDDQMLNAAKNTSGSVLLFSIIIAIIAALAAMVIARGIIKPINKGVWFAKKLSEGDLTASIDVDQKDEIGQLSGALNEMSQRLRNIVGDIFSGADNIAAASQQMAGTSQEMSQGASEQASSVEEVTSSMEEMSANIEQNTENAQGTEKIAINAAQGIKEGSIATNTAVDGMKNIAEKIRIINDIAFQTNILALNAAVEAARAGEHGKGFAVVAAEVRKLAERSKIAADEIDELSKNGVDIAEKAGEKLNDIVPDIEKTSQLVQEIASASLEQRSGADQVNNAIQQLNNVTQQNAAASEELATSAEELASQAEQLKGVISFFKTGKNYTHKTQIDVIKKPEQLKHEKVKDEELSTGKGELTTVDNSFNDDEFENY